MKQYTRYFLILLDIMLHHLQLPYSYCNVAPLTAAVQLL